MLCANNKISIRQLQILLILDCLGTGVITLPRIVATHANQDGWISVLIATILACFSVFLICSVCERFPKQSFVSYSSQILSRPIGVIISLAFVAKILMMVSIELRFFGEIVNQTMLPNTPVNVIGISMILLSAYVAAKGYEARARAAEILIFIVLLPLAILFIIAMFDIDLSNMMPVLVAEPTELLMGGKSALLAFSNIQLLMLAYPYLCKLEGAKRSMIQTVAFIGAIFTIITVITIAQFGSADVQNQVWAVIEMMLLIQLPGSFIERQDALMMSFWIISVFAIVNAGLFFTSMILKDVFNKGKQSGYILCVIPVVFLISVLPDSVLEIYTYKTGLETYLSLAFMFAVPLVLLIVAKIRNI